MRNRLLQPSIVGLTVLALIACGEETTTEPTSPTQPTSVAPEFAVASNTWITRAKMPNRSELATATVTNAAGQSIVYAIGGINPSGWDPTTTLAAYNVATNTWRFRRPLPKPLAGTNGAGVLDGKIYVTGGFPDFGMNYPWPTVYMYDPATDTWTRKRDMPKVLGDSGLQYPAGRGVTGVIGGKLYVVSGCYLKDPTYGSLGQVCNPLFFRYNQATDGWVKLPPPFSPANHATDPSIGGVIDGKFYVMAGSFEPSDPTGGVKAYFAVYDPATNQWTARTPLGLERQGAASAVLGGKLYLMGGLRFNGGGLDILDITTVYDPVTDAWTRRAFLPSPRYGASASKVLLNGKARIELIGGFFPLSPKPENNLQYVP